MSILPTPSEININNKFFQKEIASSKITELYSQRKIKPAFCQHPINDDKVKDLINTYKSSNGHYIHKLRNQITFAVYQANTEYEFLNIDGQHRMEMGIQLWKNDKISINFIVNFIFCNTSNDIYNIFCELNHDSERKPFILNNDYFLWDLRNILINKYGEYFVKTHRRNSHLYTINEFIINLQQVNIEKHLEDKKYDNIELFLEKLIKSNKEFNSKVNEHGYTQLQNNHISNRIFYQDELTILKNHDPITIGFKRNNFLFQINEENNKIKRGWFFRNKTIIPTHNPRKERESITQETKRKVWEKEYEDICDSDDDVFELNPKCPVYKCKNKIKFETCEMGHLRSVSNGGGINIDNLRPICRTCNQKMSDINWSDYEREIKRELKKL